MTDGTVRHACVGSVRCKEKEVPIGPTEKIDRLAHVEQRA
jgi:hypothetical protein